MSDPLLALIVAASSNDVIGRDGDLPWRLPADLKHFRKVTMGKPILMGRKTFDSIGKPLPGRENIVVTRDPEWRADGVHVVTSGDAAVALGKQLASDSGAEEVMLIGGAQLYQQLLPATGRIYLTRLHKVFDGDTCLPPINWTDWYEIANEDHKQDTDSPCDYSFLVYERNAQIS